MVYRSCHYSRSRSERDPRCLVEGSPVLASQRLASFAPLQYGQIPQVSPLSLPAAAATECASPRYTRCPDIFSLFPLRCFATTDVRRDRVSISFFPWWRWGSVLTTFPSSSARKVPFLEVRIAFDQGSTDLVTHRHNGSSSRSLGILPHTHTRTNKK
ncbi:unnamed protein product [Ixodes persulcatus]